MDDDQSGSDGHQPGSDGHQPGSGEPKRPLRLWPYGLGLGIIVIVVLASGAWLLHLGRDAQRQLTAARTDVTSIRTDIRADNTTSALASVADLQKHANKARDDSRDPLWRLVGSVPDVGSDLKVAGGLADLASTLANQVLPPLVTATDGLHPSSIRGPDGDIDLTKVETIGTAVHASLPVLQRAQLRLSDLQHKRVHLNELATARTELATELGNVATTLTTLDQTLTLLPPMLGAGGTRRYFLVFQNLAEARGTGGLMGAYGIITATDGKITLDKAGPDGDLQDVPTLQPAAVEPGGDYDSTWGAYGPTQDYFVANLSPHFPDAGQLFSEHADQQLGGHVDGVIAIDPLTLGALLGPDSVTLSDGTVVTGATAGRVTMSDLYTKYGGDSPVRKELLVELAKQAFTEVRTAPASRVLSALQSSIGAGRLQIWSSHTTEEAELAATDVGGVLPVVPGPFAFLAVNNTGPKTDYWLDRSLTYTTGACPAAGAADQTRESEIDVTLTDRVPPGQNAIVSKDSDDPSAPYGRGHDLVSVYGPIGADFEGVTLNGQDAQAVVSTERGHLVMAFDLLEPDGVPQKLAFTFSEPAAGTPSSFRPQPLARPETVTQNVFACK